MYNYISYIICCIILIFLIHYIYDKIKDSIIYCINYNPYNNYEIITLDDNTDVDTVDNNHIDNYIEKDVKDKS
jgi:hypothetical protein